MRHRPGLWWWPLRIAFGLFFVHTALGKRELDAKGIKGMHRFASMAYPVVEHVDATRFVQGMGAAETAIATSLLVPVVPATVGAAGLAAYGAGLFGLFLRVPGLRREGSLRPTDAGMAVAKDSWMLAAGLALLVDAIASPRHR